MSELELRHIACVDDDADIRHITALSLEAIGGLRVTTFAGPKLALAGLATADPDLVLLDVMMPEMDGLAMFREMARSGALRHLPVVFMTARVQTTEIQQYRALGAAGVIAKPFDPMTLAPELRKTWSQITARPVHRPLQIGAGE
jgi:two-component system, OmpR family, response regulator